MRAQDHHAGSSSRLSAAALSVGYGDSKIIEALDVEVKTGGLTVLVGSNGCGKSTLLKAMARVLVPQGGYVLLDGKDIHKSPTRDVARKLGLLPQGPLAPEGLTVRELVAQGRFPHQSLLRQWTAADETAVNSAMATAQIADFADRAVDTLSGGQRQRCWIAMVLAQETDLILLDEPTTFLDLKVQVDVMNLLADLAHKTGRTLVVVLHELSLAAAYADVLVMMKQGEIICSGAPEAIFTSENLRKVFGLEASVLRDPNSGRLFCMPTRGTPASAEIAVAEAVS